MTVTSAGANATTALAGAVLHLLLYAPAVIELKAKHQLAAAKKQKFGFKEAYYSSGFFSTWLPPKIN